MTAIGPNSELDVRPGSANMLAVIETINRLSDQLGYRPDLGNRTAAPKPKARARQKA